jgi:hypothetical protein
MIEYGADNSIFLNEKQNIPILKYKMFFVFVMFVFIGLIIVFILHSFMTNKPISGHNFVKHIFEKPDMNKLDIYDDSDSDNDIYDYTYSENRLSSAAVFRKALEGFRSKNESKKGSGSGGSGSGGSGSGGGYSGNKPTANVSGAKRMKEQNKSTPCDTDCGEYIKLQGQINTLEKMVKEVKQQKDKIEEITKGISALGKQIEDLNKSLAPNGKFEPKL